MRQTILEQRIALMWPLAVDATAYMGQPVTDPRVPRDVVRVIRLQDDHGWTCEPTELDRQTLQP